MEEAAALVVIALDGSTAGRGLASLPLIRSAQMQHLGVGLGLCGGNNDLLLQSGNLLAGDRPAAFGLGRRGDSLTGDAMVRKAPRIAPASRRA